MRDYPTPEAQDEAARLAWTLCRNVLRDRTIAGLEAAEDLLQHLQTCGVLTPDEATRAYVETEALVEHGTVHICLTKEGCLASWLEIDPLLGDVTEY